MPAYRIHRLKAAPRTSFRFAPHTAGAASIRPRDYEEAGTVEAPSPYAAWNSLRETATPLQLGDVLEQPGGVLCIYKYVGFEAAEWVRPEAGSSLEASSPAA